MSSKNEKPGNMSSNDFGAVDIFRKCPGMYPRHVLSPQMCPQFFKRTGWDIAN